MQKITPDFLSQASAKRITLKNGERSSRFRVDLPLLARDEENRQREINETFLRKRARKLQSFFNQEETDDEKVDLILGVKEIGENILGQRAPIIKRLAFYPLWRGLLLALKGLSRMSYYLGYVVLYIFRFFYLSVSFLLSFGRDKLRQRKKLSSRNIISAKDDYQAPANFQELDYSDKEKEKWQNKIFAYLKKKHGKEKAAPEARKDKNIEPRQSFILKNLIPRKVNLAPALYFMIALLIFTLPLKAMTYYQGFSDLKGRVLGATESAIEDLGKVASDAANEDFSKAGNDFLSASNNFSLANTEIGNINSLLRVLAHVVPSEKIKMASQAESILKAGEVSSLMGAKLLEILGNFDKENLEIANYLEALAYNSNELAALGSEFNKTINQIDEDVIPHEYIETFKLMKEKAELLNRSLNELKEILNIALSVLGYDESKRYLMVFQNNTELRASGGFIGSYALIDFQSGEIKNLEVPGGGSYDTEAGLYDMIASPQPLSLVSPRWYFWDANWWPDWPLSAEKLMWFYEKSNGPTVDGVISLTPTVLEALLGVVGEIDLSAKYGVKVNSENFWKVTQTMAEEKPAIATTTDNSALAPIRHEPKKIIGDLFSALIEELPKRLDKDTMLKFVSEIERLGREKQILFYFKDPVVEKTISDFGWGGEVVNTGWDYLMVINTNIAGAKTDRDIVEIIDHVSEVQYDNSIINTVTIKRIHTAVKGEEFTGVRNVNWLRVYVPEGSELISATGFKKPHGRYFEEADPSWQDDPDVITREGRAVVHAESDTLVYRAFNKTVFANWSMIEPGEIGEIVIKYKLPFLFQTNIPSQNNWQTFMADVLNPNQEQMLPYALYVQKQSGSLGSTFRSSLTIPDDFSPAWSYGDGIKDTSHGWELEGKLDTDKFWAVITRQQK